jgi:hypothetical protein
VKTPRILALLTLFTTLFWAAPLLAASAYFEGWDSGTTGGWSRSTINCEVFGDAAVGNPGGSLRIVPTNSDIALIGALTVEPVAVGDYAAAGIRRVSFDLINQSVPVTALWFRVRYLDEFHNGWIIPLGNFVAQGQWTSYVVEFDPTWSDAEAIAAGWLQESTSASFAATMAAVYYPEVRLRASPVIAGAELRLDNFRLTSCNNDVDAPDGSVIVDRNSLWPPNHKMIDVHAAVQAEDFCDSNPSVTLVDATSNEPDGGLGNGDRPGDIEIVSDFHFRFRSERDSHGEGREYTITYRIEDASGNVTLVSAVVTVPVSQTPEVLAGTQPASAGSESDAHGNLVLHIPSRLKGLDARTIDPASVAAGNHVGVVAPFRTVLGDVNGDGLPDLTLTFPAADIEELSRRAAAQAFAEQAGSAHWDGALARNSRQPIGLHFVAGGVSYLADDILSSRLVRIPADDVADDRIDEDLQPAARPGVLAFTLPQAGRINVSVFDVQGRRIRTLFDGESAAGPVSFEWDRRDAAGRSAPSGMYFARITGAGATIVRRVPILR